jgi:hypothetical protein
MPRVYATPTDLADYTGKPAPEDAAQLLAQATQMLEAHIFRLAWYAVDTDGMPTSAPVIAAFRDAVCAQVQWWSTLGDSIGAKIAGWGQVRIGSVLMSRSVTATAGEDSPARQIAPQVWDVLTGPDLTPNEFVLLVVT